MCSDKLSSKLIIVPSREVHKKYAGHVLRAVKSVLILI